MKRVIDWLLRRPRNKPGGMAWIRGLDGAGGAHVLNGRAVRTVRVSKAGYWHIEPLQHYLTTTDTTFLGNDTLIPKGNVATITAITDACLEPWKEDGVTDSEVRALYAPKLTAKETA